MNKTALLAAVPVLFAAGRVGGDSIGRYRLSDTHASTSKSISIARAPDDSVAKAAYEKNCRKCHGSNGVPSKVMLKKFSKIEPFDAAFFSKRSDDSIVTVLTKGTKQEMKSFKDKLSHDEMKAIAAYIRSLGK